MSVNQRPMAVTAIAWLFIAVGIVTFLFHSPGLLHPHWDDFLIEFTELLALTAGIYMLRGKNWARWLALFWMASHVVISAFPPLQRAGGSRSDFCGHHVLASAIRRGGILPWNRRSCQLRRRL